MIDLRDNVPDAAPCHCGNCDWRGPAGFCRPITNIDQRIAPGEVVPVGECPSCGALAHLADDFGKTSPEFDKGYDDGFADGHDAGIGLTLPALRQAAQRFRNYESLYAAKAVDMAAVCERVITEAEQFSPDARPTPALQAILDDMLAYEAERFDAKPVLFYVKTWRLGAATTTHGPYDSREVAEATLATYLHDGMMDGQVEEEFGELDVNGADLVDAFTEWRGQIREALHARRTALADGGDLISQALRIGLNIVAEAAEEQASGVAEGIYDADPDVTAKIARDKALIEAAIKAVSG